MSFEKLDQLNFICVYCEYVNHFGSKKEIFEKIKNPIFECLKCKELLEINQIEQYIIKKIDVEELK